MTNQQSVTEIEAKHPTLILFWEETSDAGTWYTAYQRSARDYANIFDLAPGISVSIPEKDISRVVSSIIKHGQNCAVCQPR